MTQPAERGRFEARRRKEQVAFLVVKFLRLYISFKEIAAEFHTRSAEGRLPSAGLFPKVAALAQGLGFDLKELAHTLFRNGQDHPSGSPEGREALASMKTTLERRFLDSSIGTGYHLLMILVESLYQLEHYSPELDREMQEIERAMQLAAGAEVEGLRVLDEISGKIAVDAAELAHVVIGRCEDLLEATARVIRRFGTSAADNEILVLNLLQNRDLVEAVYGEGSAETILSELCARKRYKGRTGLERALAFVKARCGNVSGLGPAGAA